MTDQSPLRSVRLTDPRALRAYAHPTRMALVGLLRRDGPQTATQAARVIGESVASCSFHLRQLARYGVVEEAGGGRGREKPWRATAMLTSWEAVPEDPAAAAATEALQLAVAELYLEQTVRWVRRQSQEPPEWQRAAQCGDSLLHLTAAELQELGDKIQDLMRPYLDRLEDADARPAGSRPVTVLHLAFPNRLADEPTGSTT
ncbi:helix-turn-helix domain-containing protein [Cellulomonas sp. P24]|uniref:winged helix-turn-helix domain-containing protein n=1 Tax=Cellulomonas sp. P24 TaxID=2885206 RepID=UPI00216AD61D|nr:helix-turn-helix domain-containing protein [Cellulomonas sp. P24]MCR6494413.1 helix-turn-helix domain-containing protein [Cellulomonas sp. P24]